MTRTVVRVRIHSGNSLPAASAIWRNALIAAGVSAVVNAILFFVGAALGGFPDTVITPMGVPITILTVVVMSIIPVVVGTVVYQLLTRFTARANFWFMIIAAVVFVLMFFSPLGLQSVGAPMLMIVLLEIMHVVTAGAAVYFLTRS